MSRLFATAFCIFAATAPTRAADPVPGSTPETLLSPSSQLYFRWDGVTPHADTYKKSYWGGVMAGPTGDSVRALIAKVPKLLGNSLLADPLLDGKPLAELKANLADLKNASKFVDLLADKGIVVGAEIREPKASLKGLSDAFGGLLRGKLPGPEALVPDVQVLLVMPDVGDRSEVLFAALRLALQSGDYGVEPFAAHGRKGFKYKATAEPRQPRGAKKADPADVEIDAPEAKPLMELQGAWWLEGKHFVLYIGTTKPETMVEQVQANAKLGGISKHPLFMRCQEKPAFTSVARGFVDAGKIVGLAKSIAGPFVPGLNQRLDDLGLGNLRAVILNSGFEGKESRSVWEIDLAGERKGFANMLKNEPLTLKDLPPMPADVSRFLAVRVNAKATYDAGLAFIETLGMNEPFGDDEVRTPSEKIQLRRDYLAKEFDRSTGLNVKEDVLPCIGDKVVVYQSPNEGLAIFGTVFCVSLKDPAKAKALADRIHTGLETLVSAPVKVRKKMLKGVEYRELHSRGFGILVPTYAVVGEWLVVSLYPQGVQGFILRSKGDLTPWKPDTATAARLAKLPADACALQFCDPSSTAKNLCCIGPLFLGTLGLRGNFGNENTETDFDPLDVGLIPNAHELSKHLFPNLTVIRDDGKTLRIEANESFSLPLEIVGMETLAVAISIFGFAF